MHACGTEHRLATVRNSHELMNRAPTVNAKFPRSSSPRSATHRTPVHREPADQLTEYRILDANLNRCLEGLRVVEEYLRFGCADAYLAGLCKQLRHDLVSWSAVLPMDQLHGARDTTHDVGTHVETVAEYQRPDLHAVVAANCKRVEQALRSLEEYGKLVAADAARQVEGIRYRVYMLERAITTTRGSRARLRGVRLCALIDGRATLDQFVQLLQPVLRGGADMIQLRDKCLTDRQLLDRAHAARELTRRTHVLLIVNDRPDLAAIADADGVHLGQDDLPVAAARGILGPQRLIGVSTHDIQQVEKAVCDGADYIGCGPAFPSTTKSFAHYPGLDFLRRVHATFCIPAFAIGGITEATLGDVLGTGLDRVAVAHGIVGADDPLHATRQLRQRLEAAPVPADQH